jgi:hypothetical protein
MFTLLTNTTSGSNSIVALVISIIIVAAVIIGAGFLLYKLIKSKKINLKCLKIMVDYICKNDDKIYMVVRQIFIKYDCFKSSNTCDEFIENVYKEARELLYDYLTTEATCIPSSLKRFVTLENMDFIAKEVLTFLGYGYDELSKLFEDYIAEEAAKELNTDTESAPATDDAIISDDEEEKTREVDTTPKTPVGRSLLKMLLRNLILRKQNQSL